MSPGVDGARAGQRFSMTLVRCPTLIRPEAPPPRATDSMHSSSSVRQGAVVLHGEVTAEALELEDRDTAILHCSRICAELEWLAMGSDPHGVCTDHLTYFGEGGRRLHLEEELSCTRRSTLLGAALGYLGGRLDENTRAILGIGDCGIG